MPALTSPLRIAVLGAGQIGSGFAARLVSVGGHNVTVIARPRSVRLQQLERDGAIVEVNGDQSSIHVCSLLDEHTPYDLLIVTLKAYQAEAVLPALERSAAKCILFMFNTFHPERLEAAVGADRCAFGMPFIEAKLDDTGKLQAKISSTGQKTIMSGQVWVDLFNAAGLPAALEPEMPLWLRCHVPLCIAFQSVSIAGVRRRGGASWREALVLAQGVNASFKLIEGLGYQVYPKTKGRIAKAPKPVIAGVLWVMSRIRSFRELLATGRSECCALVDDLVAVAPLAMPSSIISDIAAMKPV